MNRQLQTALLSLALATSAHAQCGLIISEYIEGSSNNKAIELYNGTGAEIDLALGQYVLQSYPNGGITPSTLSLTGKVAASATYVIVNSASAAGLLAYANQTAANSAPMNFNGDDALALRSGGASGTIIDTFGKFGQDPGSSWSNTIGTIKTVDSTLRRKATVTAGDTTFTNDFDPSIEWESFPIDTFTNLGTHVMNCGVSNTPPEFNSIGNRTATNGLSLVFTVTATDPVDNDLITLSAENLPTGAVFDPVTNATAVTNTFTWNPVGTAGVYAVQFLASDKDGVTTQAVTITVVDPPATNTPPVMAAITPRAVLVGNEVSFNLTASDLFDNDSITLSASNLPPGAIFNSTPNPTVVTGSFVWVSSGPVGVYTTTFYAVDKDGVTSQTAVLTIDTLAIEAGASNVWINEVNYDEPSTETNEYIELAGVAGTDLTGYSLVYYNGSNGRPFYTTNLTGVLIDDEACGIGAVSIFIPPTFENGPEAIALVHGSTLLQYIGFEGFVAASNGPAAGLTNTVNIGSQVNSTNTLYLAGIASNYAGFAWTNGPQTPGTLNVGQFIPGCAPCNLSFSPATFSTNEPAGTFVFAIHKSVAASNVTADLVIGGTATQGIDFTLSTTNVLMAASVTSQLVTVTLLDDGIAEGTETLTITITNLVDSQIGSPSSLNLTITDNDLISLIATSANQIVQSSSTNMTVGGSASEALVGELVWSNTSTGASGTWPVSTNWLIAAIPLQSGSNVLTITGTNAFGVSTQVVRMITRLWTPYAGPDVIRSQDFETTDTWAIVTGSNFISSATGAADFPPGQRIFSGTQSWQVNNAAGTLDLADISLAGYTGRQVSLRVTSTALTSAQGAEVSDKVQFFIGLDGAGLPISPNMELPGNSNARWGFWATNVAALTHTQTVAIGSTTSSTMSNNYSELIVLIPESATSLTVRVVANNNDPNEFWNIDAIRVTGYAVVTGDGDGLPDDWEIANFGTTTNEPSGDADGDGFSNLQEYIAGTGPTNTTGYLRLEGLSNQVLSSLSFFGVTGRLYMIDYSDALLDPNSWIEFTNGIAGTNGVMRIPDPVPATNRGYRLRVRLE